MSRPPLTMRCDVERRGAGSDPFGGNSTYTTHLSGEPCYWWVSSGREQIDDARTAVVADERILFDRGTDVRPGDRIVEVVDHQGRTVFTAGDFREVEHVAVERTHLDCSLRLSA